jgi:hypothetical protein
MTYTKFNVCTDLEVHRFRRIKHLFNLKCYFKSLHFCIIFLEHFLRSRKETKLMKKWRKT